jgi:hypothetical protein
MTDLGLFLLMCAAICLLIGAIKFLAWVSDAVERHRAGEPWIEVRPMSKVPAPPAPVVMSRATPEVAPSPPSDLRQTAAPDQTDALPAPVVKSATLDTCKTLRGLGMSREQARTFLRSLGWGLDNNTWAAAKEDADDLTLTPFAGRVTRRSFYETEPELEYQEPPA